MVGVGSARELQTIIARERKAGAVILSSCAGGYYLPASREEVEEFVRTQDKKARSIMFVLKSARQYMNQLDGQMTMTEGGFSDGSKGSKEGIHEKVQGSKQAKVAGLSAEMAQGEP